MAVLAAATFGSVVMFLVTWTSNPLRDWMFARGAPAYGIELAVAAMYVLPGTFAWFAFGVALLGGMSLWAMKRHPAVTPVRVIGGVVVLFFLLTAAYELALGIPGGIGNWQASNAGGLTLKEGLITPLGWLSTGRRGLVAAVVAGLTAVVFLTVYQPSMKAVGRLGQRA